MGKCFAMYALLQKSKILRLWRCLKIFRICVLSNSSLYFILVYVLQIWPPILRWWWLHWTEYAYCITEINLLFSSSTVRAILQILCSWTNSLFKFAPLKKIINRNLQLQQELPSRITFFASKFQNSGILQGTDKRLHIKRFHIQNGYRPITAPVFRSRQQFSDILVDVTPEIEKIFPSPAFLVQPVFLVQLILWKTLMSFPKTPFRWFYEVTLTMITLLKRYSDYITGHEVAYFLRPSSFVPFR